MPKPHRINEIPEDMNLFRIPKKKGPREDGAQVSGHQVSGHQVGSGHTLNPYPRSGGCGGMDQQAKYWDQKVKVHAEENMKLQAKLASIIKHRDHLLTVLSSQQQGGAQLDETKARLEAEESN